MPASPKTSPNWTRQQTLAALHIYFQLPFGQLHRGQPKIKQIAQWIGRTPSSAAMKLTNLASLDPQIIASGRKGMGHASKLDEEIWQELQTHWDPIALEAAAEYEKLVIASHIVQWSEDKQNRLNPHNGPRLSALHDKAYDQGLTAVMPYHTVRASKPLHAQSQNTLITTSLLRFDFPPHKHTRMTQALRRLSGSTCIAHQIYRPNTYARQPHIAQKTDPQTQNTHRHQWPAA
jgi:hypothetical protein